MKKMLSLMAMFLGIILMQSFSVPEAKAADCSGISKYTGANPYPTVVNNKEYLLNPVYTLCDATYKGEVAVQGSPVSEAYPFKNKVDRDGLLNKVAAADAKLDVNKPCDAELKLDNYGTSLDNLLGTTRDHAKAKIYENYGLALEGYLNDALTYVGGICNSQK